ncbi:MAG TPA: hypothetical protein PLH98_02445 [Ruminococcus flavefaciens]|nr:hypothetical protein [Ruminococcus flavefaciens]HQL99408.1 hypothetical protein [Ruminococcus flavefaciens]
MEVYRKKLEKQKKICGWISLISFFSIIPIFIICHFNEHAVSLIHVALVALVISLITHSSLKKALKNDEAFKKMYVRDTDERNIQIGKMAANSALFISIGIFIAAAEAARWMNYRAVSLTLSLAAIMVTIIYMLSMAYFRKKL